MNDFAHPDIEAVILEVLQNFPDGATMAEVVSLSRMTVAGAGRPGKVKASALNLIATERVVLTPELRLRLPTPPALNLDPLFPAAVYAREAKIPPPSGRTPKVIRAMLDRAFRTGVKEGRRRQERDHARETLQKFPRLDHGMFRSDHE